MSILTITSKIPGSHIHLWRHLSTSSSTYGNINSVSVDDIGVGKQAPRKPPLTSFDDATLKPFDSMPGPKGLPVIGTLWDYLKKDGFKFNKMFEVMQERSRVFGPVYREKIADREAVIVSDPEEYAKVIRVDGRFPHRIELEPMVHYRKKKGMALGTVNSQGEEWHRHRTILSKKMLRPKEVLDYTNAMNAVSNDFIKRLKSIRTSTGIVPDLEHELFKWALESVGTVLFEDRIGCFKDPPSPDAQAFIHNLLGFFKEMQPLMYNVPIYKYYQTKTWKRYEAYSDKVIEIGLKYVNKKVEALNKQAREGILEGEKEEKSAFLTYLLSQKELTPEEANSHVIDLMSGAVETTSNAMIWTLMCLSKSPESQRALQRETDQLLGRYGQITKEKIPEMKYVKACLKEMFRLYPITFATSRIIHEPIEVGGFHVPAGTHVQANLYGMGHDPKLFDDPEKFRPERWIREDESDEKGKNAFATLPWGHGARMCLGRRVAEQEMYIILTKLMQHFNVEYHGDPIKPVLNTVMTPDKPVRFTFVPRL